LTVVVGDGDWVNKDGRIQMCNVDEQGKADNVKETHASHKRNTAVQAVGGFRRTSERRVCMARSGIC
jgi:hypothetical protein